MAVAPSITLWSHPIETLTIFLGTNYPSTYLGKSYILPIATIEVWGANIKGLA